MDLGLDERQRLLQTTAREFLEAECPITLVREMESSDEGFSAELWEKVAELGWQGLSIPAEFGGAGGSLVDQEVLSEEVGRALMPGPSLASNVFSAQILLNAGNQTQKHDLLPGIARGEITVTAGLNNLGAGASHEELGLRAVTDSGGYFLDGAILFVPYAHVADYIICAAESSTGDASQLSEAGIAATLFLVDTKSVGLKADPLESIGGYKQHEVVYERVRVEPDGVLGRVGGALDYLAKAAEWATVIQCGEIVGRSEKVLELVVEYSKNRVQFGRPIGSFQAVQHRCADLRVAVDGARLITRQAAWKLTEGLPCSEDVSMAKASAGCLSRLATATGHSIFAGIAFTVEHDMQLYTMRSKVAEAILGDSDYHLAKVATQIGL